jgi:hypothetical protein
VRFADKELPFTGDSYQLAIRCCELRLLHILRISPLAGLFVLDLISRLFLVPLLNLLPPAMFYRDIPLIIPILATGYLLAIYLLLVLAQRNTKVSRERD